MTERAKDLDRRLSAFNQELIAFVENCSDGDWQKVCSGENWSVAVLTRHIPAAHYRAFKLAKMIVAGEPLPQMTMEAIDQMNAQHAEKYANCTKGEVLGLLREHGESIAEYVSQLSDDDLDRKGHIELMGGDISVQKFIENVILVSCGEHLANMKAATAG